MPTEDIYAGLQEGYFSQAVFDANPTHVLLRGQRMNLEQTGKYKIGDGTTQLQNLNFLGVQSGGPFVPLSTKNQPGGYVGLNNDSNAYVPGKSLSLGTNNPIISSNIYIGADSTGAPNFESIFLETNVLPDVTGVWQGYVIRANLEDNSKPTTMYFATLDIGSLGVGALSGDVYGLVLGDLVSGANSSRGIHSSTNAAANVWNIHFPGTAQNYINGKTGIGVNSPSEMLHVVGKVRIVDGNQAEGKVFTTDSNGVGTWRTPSGGASPIVAYQNIDSSVTGTTARTIVANLRIPAGTMGPNGLLIIRGETSKTGNLGNAVIRMAISDQSGIYAGKPEFSAVMPMATNTRWQGFRFEMVNKNSVNVNYMSDITTLSPEVQSTNDDRQVNVNWAVDQYVVFTFNLGNAADSATLRNMQVLVYNP